jgi:hypothetical protein
MPADSDRGRGLDRLRSVGEELASALAGGALGSIGGPAGILAGALGGVTVRHTLQAVGEEVDSRALAPREAERIGAVLNLAAREIELRRESGLTVRDDGFFDADDPDDAPAAELLEGTLLRAGESYEKRKLPYLAKLFANVAFRPDVPASLAHYLLTALDRLTYTQLCLLALFAREDRRDELRGLQRRQTEWRGEPPAAPSVALMAELDQLGNESLLGFVQQGGWVAHFAAVLEGGRFAPSFGKVRPMPAGEALYELAGLADVSDTELDALVDQI